MTTEQFASDNYSGICPEALQAIEKANNGDAFPYGEDEWTQKAADLLRDFFETDCDNYFVFNGTAANSLALSSLCQSYHSLICTNTSHIETDECGAPEFFSNGIKILLGKEANGKLTPEQIEAIVTKRSDIHYPKPKVISLTQSTELGTVYTTTELTQIKNMAEKYGLRIHMDGARFSNAIVSSGKTPAEMTWKSGVDVLCLGGTKNGMSLGEAVIFFNRELGSEFAYRCKQAGQLASKMRFISCQWAGFLETGIWRKNATHANECARYLADQLGGNTSLNLLYPVEVNAVFVQMPEKIQAGLRNLGYHFYTFIGAGGVRFMTSWNTTTKRIDQLVEDINRLTK